MKITGSDNEIVKHVNEAALTRTKESAEKARTPADVPPETTGDAIVNLSQASKEVQKAKEVIESEPDVRLEKVQAIKKKIENGTFEIDYVKTAEKMLKAFSDEIIPNPR
ncbi:MAG: flagellar biosynthesis anti-sigma factor FlgM [Desulfobacterales bacterium]|nr:flagellar biosynthesis anti-sigma factor FlgM [Desulfobacterales bacterium]